MAEPVPLDADWLADHPLPQPGEDSDKNSRGHVIAIGGSRQVPGGLLLTGEAAFRAGAGKVQLATIASCTQGLGLALPEAGVLALGESEDGEIDAGGLEPLEKPLARCDSLVIGPAITRAEAAGGVLDALLDGMLDKQPLLLDAVALHAASGRVGALRRYGAELLVSPNPDELASLLGCDEERVTNDQTGCAREAAERYRALAICKGAQTVIARPEGVLLRYPGGGVGLATGGSGDVLAGLIAGMLARGAEPVTAAAWGVWLHGEAGRRLAERQGTLGFLARELIPLVPALMRGAG
ncbi:NAD(P)H-hydrate dehydratase [Qipengyuania sediminis]|uniref:NAD(P)H-hydrate dehydratase n=1 Tax=Qipengyuania sediminis TaxID=1532023 RepID=UPI001F0DF688|nr:NAD(P)H-hydrate dehydratase [Qipengyuania sediminis]